MHGFAKATTDCLMNNPAATLADIARTFASPGGKRKAQHDDAWSSHFAKGKNVDHGGLLGAPTVNESTRLCPNDSRRTKRVCKIMS